MKSSPASMPKPIVYTDALEAALGRVIKDARREFELYQAKTEALLSEARAQIAEIRAANAVIADELRQMVADRLATVKDGAPGRDGESITGPMGGPGERGEKGEPGADGRDADPALIAEMVRAAVDEIPRPVNGEKGDPGERGEKGEPGADGRDGVDGERGLDGAPGKLALVRAWSDGVHYEGDCVVYNGATWQAQRDTGHAPPHDDWACLAAAGENGRSLAVRGTFDSSAEYRMLDIVAMNGASFVALKDVPGECPGEGWQLLASPGKRGQKGEDGERGFPGRNGDRGSPGPALISASIDDDGILTLTRDDGVAVTADFYPVLRSLK